jgi:hypothetical protein
MAKNLNSDIQPTLNLPNSVTAVKNIYLYTPNEAKMKLISAGSTGNTDDGGNANSSNIQLNDAGQVVFDSQANNLASDLIPNDSNFNVYFYSKGAKLKLISNDGSTGGGNGRSSYPQINAAGNVAFGSSASNLDSDIPIPQGNAFENVYLHAYVPSIDLTPNVAGTDVAGTYITNQGQDQAILTADTGATVHYTIDGGAEQTALTSATLTLPEGRHTISYWASANGNSCSPVSKDFLIDTQAPETKADVRGGTYDKATEVNLTADDPKASDGTNSGIDKTYYALEKDGKTVFASKEYGGETIKLDASGSYKLTYYSTDNAGNQENVQTDEYTIKLPGTGTDPDPGTTPPPGPGTDPTPPVGPGTDPTPPVGPGTDPVLPAAQLKISSIKASQKTVYVVKGKKAKLPIIINAEKSAKVKANWKATKNKVASVKNIKKKKGSLTLRTNKNQNLIIKAGKKLGKSKITLTAGGKKIVFTVKVVKRAKAVAKSSVKIKKLPSKKVLKRGKSKTLKAAFTKTATAIVTWKSSKPKVVKIDASGKITALKKGKAKITLKVGGKRKTVVIKVK